MQHFWRSFSSHRTKALKHACNSDLSRRSTRRERELLLIGRQSFWCPSSSTDRHLLAHSMRKRTTKELDCCFLMSKQSNSFSVLIYFYLATSSTSSLSSRSSSSRWSTVTMPNDHLPMLSPRRNRRTFSPHSNLAKSISISNIPS